jgi:hypothetical protein
MRDVQEKATSRIKLLLLLVVVVVVVVECYLQSSAYALLLLSYISELCESAAMHRSDGIKSDSSI